MPYRGFISTILSLFLTYSHTECIKHLKIKINFKLLKSTKTPIIIVLNWCSETHLCATNCKCALRVR